MNFPKAVLFVLIFGLALNFNAFAQGSKIVVDESLLTADQLARAKAADTKANVSENVRWGHEIGVAVKETLSSVTDETAKFAKTDPGKLTMFLVAWKIMAQDVLTMGDKVIGYLVGVPLLFGGLLVTLWSYRRQCVPHMVVTEKGSGLWIWRSKKYEMYDPSSQKGNLKQDDWVLVHCCVAALIVFISALSIFAG
jgi:hypothetical protein